jgi:hypothetical protein
MTREFIVPMAIFAAVFAVAVSVFYKSFKYGGFKAGMFGAPIERTVGEAAGAGTSFMNNVIKVHVLGGSSLARAVGIEVTAKSFLSYQMLPVALSVPEADRLIELLRQAVAGR